MNETYLIDDAAKYVDISRRNFERMNIGSREEIREAKDGKKRKVRVYDKAELDRVKLERETPSHKPSLVATTDANQSQKPITLSDLEEFKRLFVDTIIRENKKVLALTDGETKKKKIDISTFKDKMILNFAQALAYSGLPEVDIKKGLKDEKILAKKTSENGNWKIDRVSLEKFCRSYFD
jgi:hypothetical protein